MPFFCICKLFLFFFAFYVIFYCNGMSTILFDVLFKGV